MLGKKSCDADCLAADMQAAAVATGMRSMVTPRRAEDFKRKWSRAVATDCPGVLEWLCRPDASMSVMQCPCKALGTGPLLFAQRSGSIRSRPVECQASRAATDKEEHTTSGRRRRRTKIWMLRVNKNLESAPGCGRRRSGYDGCQKKKKTYMAPANGVVLA